MREKLSSPVADRPKIPFLNQDALQPDVGSRRRDLEITEERKRRKFLVSTSERTRRRRPLVLSYKLPSITVINLTLKPNK